MHCFFMSALALYITKLSQIKLTGMRFDEIWNIVECFLVNIFSFLVVFDWNNPKMIIILIHHFITVHKHRWCLFLLIYIPNMPTLYYVK